MWRLWRRYSTLNSGRTRLVCTDWGDCGLEVVFQTPCSTNSTQLWHTAALTGSRAPSSGRIPSRPTTSTSDFTKLSRDTLAWSTRRRWRNWCARTSAWPRWSLRRVRLIILMSCSLGTFSTIWRVWAASGAFFAGFVAGYWDPTSTSSSASPASRSCTLTIAPKNGRLMMDRIFRRYLSPTIRCLRPITKNRSSSL